MEESLSGLSDEDEILDEDKTEWNKGGKRGSGRTGDEDMVRLQNIIYPQTGICVEEALFFRRYGEVRYCLADEYIELEEEAMLSFDTYFNGFSASKWYKYTKLKNLNICLKLQGKFRVSLLYKEKLHDTKLLYIWTK